MGGYSSFGGGYGGMNSFGSNGMMSGGMYGNNGMM
jgi:hypothetical protein